MPGRPANLGNSRTRRTVLAAGTSGLVEYLSHVYFFLFFSSSLSGKRPDVERNTV